MRRVVLLALLALALPTAALADSISFTGELPGSLTGSFSTSLSAMFTLTAVDVNGTTSAATGSIVFNTGSLTSVTCPTIFAGGACYSFSGGSVTVSGGATFSDTFSGGFINNNNGSLLIMATLTKNSTVLSGGGTVTATFSTSGSGFALSSGSTDIAYNTNTVPEPGTLGLLGTGLIGLAGMARRKLLG